MNHLDYAMLEMKLEDRRYGDDTNTKKKILVQHKPLKNMKNLARYNITELLEMDDEGYEN